MTTIEANSTRPLGIATCRPCDDYSVRVQILIYQTRGRWSAGGRLSTTCAFVMVGRVTRKTKKKKKASSVSNYFSRRAPTCVEIKILRCVRAESFASSSTPSTRRLLDGLAMPVPRRSTKPSSRVHTKGKRRGRLREPRTSSPQ